MKKIRHKHKKSTPQINNSKVLMNCVLLSIFENGRKE